MRYQILVMTKKGHYGKELLGKCHTLRDVLDKVIPELDSVPNEIEGVNFVDWTHINIQIARDNGDQSTVTIHGT